MMKFPVNVKQYGDNILYIGYEDGVRVQQKLKFAPTLYVQSEDSNDTDFHSYTGTKLKPVEFDSIKSAKTFIKQYAFVENATIYGTDKFASEYIAREYPALDLEYKFNWLRIFGIDIEVYSGNGFPDPFQAEEEITAITIHDSKVQKFHVWTMKPYEAEGHDYGEDGDPIAGLRDKIVHHGFDNEIDMLLDFIEYWTNNFPDIVTGWHSRGFDYPYIINRIKKLFGESTVKRLSPWKLLHEKTSNISRFGVVQKETQYELVGIAELDSMDLYKKYGPGNEESFKLGHIAKKQLGITKLDYDGSLHEQYTNDYQGYIDYNIQDCNLVVGIENKCKFIELHIEVSYAAKVPNYTDALGTVKYWEIYIYNHLLSKNQLAEIKDISVDKDSQYAGAYVKDTINGLHEDVVSLDFTSLYPTTIRQVNIGPETLIPRELLPHELIELSSKVTVERLLNRELDLDVLKKYNYGLSANGQFYRNDIKSFSSEIIGHLFYRRKDYKKQMLAAKSRYEQTRDEIEKELAGRLDISQHAFKIILNSLYGAFGNAYFQFFSIENAEAVTLTGQLMIKTVANRVNKYLNDLLKTPNRDRILAIDTDSIYLRVSDVIKAVFGDRKLTQEERVDFIDKFTKQKITPIIQKECQDICDYMNHKENLMDMKQEKIIRRAVWTGKKRYFLSVCDSEGVRYAEPHLEITGMMALSTPAVCRAAIKDCMKIILNKEESDLHDYIENFKTKFMQCSPEEISRPTGINTDLGQYMGKQKGVPVHIKGALNYNNLINKNNMSLTHEKIKTGDKIKWIYLKEPNTIQDKSISFPDKLPKVFGLEKYVDYDKQFEKTFMKQITDICNIIGWKTEAVNDLSEFFT